MNRHFILFLGTVGCIEAKYGAGPVATDSGAEATADESMNEPPSESGGPTDTGTVDDGEALSMVAHATWLPPRALSLSWEAVAGARSHAISMRGPGDYTHEETGLETTEVTVDDLESGEYTAEITALDEDARAIAQVSVTQLVGENRLVYRSEVPLDRAMDVWGAGDYAIIGGGTNPSISALVVDLSDSTNPTVVNTMTDIGYVRDVKVFDDLLFTSVDPESDGCALCDDIGVRIFDFSNPVEPILLSEIGAPTSWVHNMTYADGHLYVASIYEDEVAVFDVRDPTTPARVGEWKADNVPFASLLHGFGLPPHDMTAKGDRLYVAHLTGFSIVDISDPTNPTTLADVRVNMGMHNVWPNEEETLMVGTQEILDGELSLWDISDLDDIQLLDAISTGADRSVHNGYFDNGTIFASWYIDGIFSFEVEDGQMVQTGHFDTFDVDLPPPPDDMPMSGPPIDGAWGLWTLGKHIVVGDTFRGLMVFDHYPNTVSVP